MTSSLKVLVKVPVIEWVFRTSLSSVPIAAPPLPSALRSRSFSNLKATLMSLSAVLHAARQESQSAMEIAATGPSGRCSLQYALSAAKIPRYPLNRAGTSRCIVELAVASSDRVDKRLNLKSHPGRATALDVILESRSFVVRSINT